MLNERTADAIYSALLDETESLKDPVAAMRAAARVYVHFAQRHPNRWQLLFEHRLPAGSAVPRANQVKVQRLFTFIQQRLQMLLPDADDETLRTEAAALWSGVHGVAVLAESNKLNWSGVTDFGALTDRLIDAFLK